MTKKSPNELATKPENTLETITLTNFPLGIANIPPVTLDSSLPTRLPNESHLAFLPNINAIVMKQQRKDYSARMQTAKKCYCLEVRWSRLSCLA